MSDLVGNPKIGFLSSRLIYEWEHCGYQTVVECALSTGKLSLRGLSRNKGVRIIDHPDITSAVYHGKHQLNPTKTGNVHINAKN